MQTEEEIFIPGELGEIQAKVLPVSDSSVLALVCHPHPLHQGTMDNKVVVTMVKAFAKLGFSTVRFNYRGVGKSDGAYGDITGEVADCERVLEYVKSHYKPQKVILAGFSFGAFVAAKTCCLHGGDLLISIAPSVVNMPYAQLANLSLPWQVVHGDADEVVSYAKSLEFFENKSNVEYITFKETGHFFHGKLVELANTVSEYVNSKI